MIQKLVSVMMPAYNAERYIGEAIESVRTQTYRNWELIVVDDGSTDQTASIAASFSDPRIRLLEQENGGESSARNKALQYVQGEYVAFLDADDLYLPDHLGALVDGLRRTPGADGIYSDGYYIDENRKRMKTLSVRRRGPFEDDIYCEVVHGSDVIGPPVCALLRSETIRTHRLKFDVDITIGPDWVFFMEFSQQGRFVYLDQSNCLYRIHGSNITKQVGLQRRALELAKCRIRSIKMARFGHCPLDVKTEVFYDLLVNLLRGYPERQEEIVHWSEFLCLPAEQQARLLRLMASAAMVYEQTSTTNVRLWLDRARQLSPSDRRTRILCACHRISPALCSAVLTFKSRGIPDPLSIPPFADLVESQT